ncbi:hypothetical protein NST04_14750 [Paenibacillus sp. FSL H7-0756]|uniref:hypothetical protein n=1 Tax=Paenibacillus sp. FSL H7-0756 TaxID=2954738 RepID=UPI0030FCF335
MHFLQDSPEILLAVELGLYIIAAAPNVIGFSITFGPHASAALNVIGFSITFEPHASAALNVIGFSITFGPHASAALNVIGFSITFGPHAHAAPNIVGFSCISDLASVKQNTTGYWGIRFPISQWYLLLSYSCP